MHTPRTRHHGPWLQLASQANGNYGTGISAQALKSGAPFGDSVILGVQIAMALPVRFHMPANLWHVTANLRVPDVPAQHRTFTAVALASYDPAVDLTARGQGPPICCLLSGTPGCTLAQQVVEKTNGSLQVRGDCVGESGRADVESLGILLRTSASGTVGLTAWAWLGRAS